MIVEEAIVTILRESTDLTDLIGQAVQPQSSDQGDPLPGVLYSIEQDKGTQSMRGEQVNLRSCMVRLTCFGGPIAGHADDRYATAKAIAHAAASALLSSPMRLVQDGGQGIKFRLISDEGADDDFDPPVFDDGRVADSVSWMFEVWYAQYP